MPICRQEKRLVLHCQYFYPTQGRFLDSGDYFLPIGSFDLDTYYFRRWVSGEHDEPGHTTWRTFVETVEDGLQRLLAQAERGG